MNGLRRKLPLVLSVASLILAWRVYSLYVRYASPQAPALVPAQAQADPLPVRLPVEPMLAPSNFARPAGLEVDESLLNAQQAAAEKPWGRDPFATAPHLTDAERDDSEIEDAARRAGGLPSPPSLAFNAVCGSGGTWLAVVRGGIVRVGDVIDNQYRITRIAKGSLTLSAGQWTFCYELGTSNVVVQQGVETQ